MERKWVHFLFAAGGIAVLYLFIKSGEWGWSYFGKPKLPVVYAISTVATVGVVWVAWRNEELFTLASECITELMKVSWPTRKETMTATLVVIITVVIASLFLGLFDGLWSYLTRLLYS